MDKYKGNKQRSAPVVLGQEIQVKIDAIGDKGDGIAKVNGFAIIIPKAKEGESYIIKMTRVLDKFGFAEIISKVETSEESQEENPGFQSEFT